MEVSSGNMQDFITNTFLARAFDFFKKIIYILAGFMIFTLIFKNVSLNVR